MAVDAARNTETLTVNPTKVRYSLSLDKLGTMQRGKLSLQRSDKRQDGTWLDDPRPDSRKQVTLPIGPAVEGIVALLPILLAKLGVAAVLADYRLRLTGFLSPAGVLDVSVAILYTDAGWKGKTIPSLTTFLAANQDIALQVLGAWDALDAEINAANQQEGWL